MRTYGFYRIDKAERIVGPCEYHHCEDDLAALEIGKQLVNGLMLEVWHGARFVARVKPWDASLTADDLRSL